MQRQQIAFDSLDTPVVLVDLDMLEANIKDMQQAAEQARVKLRPHTKIHESTAIAKLQLVAGACGIEVGPIDQAEHFADEGFDDIVVAHPFYGSHKLEKLKRLLNRPKLKITVVVDMLDQAEEISQVGQTIGQKVPVLLKIDTGGGRYGALPGEPALRLAKKLVELPGIKFEGIYAHEMKMITMPTTAEGVAEKLAFDTASAMTETANMLIKSGIAIRHVSVGASPTFRATCKYLKQGKFSAITEIHPGSCILGDIIYVNNYAMKEDRCAITVLASVMSTSHPDHAVLDFGSKTIGADSIIARRDMPGFFWEGKPSFGSVRGHPDLWLGRLSAETSCVYYREPGKQLRLGERLEIVPNNSIITVNIHDRLYGVRNGVVEMVIPVTGRGRGN